MLKHKISLLMGLVLNTFKTSVGSNNPMHMHSLARAFAVHIHLNILVDLLVMFQKRRPHSFAVHVLGMIRNDFTPM